MWRAHTESARPRPRRNDTMTPIDVGERACRRIQAQLDSYLDNELLIESNLEMLDHFHRCAACTREADTRCNVRTRLRGAVRGIDLPVGLEDRVRACLSDCGFTGINARGTRIPLSKGLTP